MEGTVLRTRFLFPAILILFSAVSGVAGELVLPVFALNLSGVADNVWSSEIYLTNPGGQPVLVELVRFLPGEINKPTPCDLFMPPTRVVPAQSATVWTAAGLATDLGCAEQARGGLVFRADGPVHITSRLVNMSEDSMNRAGAVLTGRGEAFEAIPITDLPRAGVHLLPALMWHRNSCDNSAFDTVIGFSNPGSDPVRVVLDVPHENRRSVRLDHTDVYLPTIIDIPPGSWRQFTLEPSIDEDVPCGNIESFLVRLETSAPLAIYGSVIDRRSGDPRTVFPVSLSQD